MVDNGPVPVPKSLGMEYRYGFVNEPVHIDHVNSMSMEQPNGPSFTVEDGYLVKWANWSFHIKPDQRAGMIISHATIRDSKTGEARSVMYKGFAWSCMCNTCIQKKVAVSGMLMVKGTP
ncbi:Amine oxidase [copper-containing] gamma 2 [Cardamine amara subsp. amara]|uniref:Amine oxidase n=1 Tax=Cardamine amara subsp. amara TaxID=228776 RepID=A0ABD0ZNA6_CARAN